MDIYVVQPGDTIYSIADKFGVTVLKLIQDNELESPNDLVIGQTIVIAYPNQTYTVKEGDTLKSIADIYNVTPMQLLRNNPYLSNRTYIYPGDTIVISYNTQGKITTNGFVYPYIKKETLIKTLPNLTYLSVFNYSVLENGDVISYEDDSEIILISKDYGAIPLMLLTTLTPQGESKIEIAFSILLNEEYQERLITNIISIMKTKGFYGLNLVIYYLDVASQELHDKFIKKVSDSLQREGYLFFITFNTNIEYIDNKISFEKVDYSSTSQIVNGMMFTKFNWSKNLGPPAPVWNINNLRAYADYAVSMVSPDKILLGIETISYDWQLPYIPDKSAAYSLTIGSALNIARDAGTIIQFDDTSQTPFFNYNQLTTTVPFEHIVWSIDARSINALEILIKEYALNGISVWNIMVYYPQLWLILNSQYEIMKFLP